LKRAIDTEAERVSNAYGHFGDQVTPTPALTIWTSVGQRVRIQLVRVGPECILAERQRLVAEISGPSSSKQQPHSRAASRGLGTGVPSSLARGAPAGNFREQGRSSVSDAPETGKARMGGIEPALIEFLDQLRRQRLAHLDSRARGGPASGLPMILGQ
jgi:hypothetical protein